ncbi:MAG: hypothetical protein ACJAZO_004389, partial [Myxococcota bacterium]
MISGDDALPIDRVSVGQATLSPGFYTIDLVVTDSAGNEVLASVNVTVLNGEAPVASILDPQRRGYVDPAVTVNVCGTARSETYPAAELL